MDLGFGRIFKDEKPLEHFEQMTHSYSLAHDSLSRSVCMGGREGAGGREAAIAVIQAQGDGAWSRLEVVAAERNGVLLNLF